MKTTFSNSNHKFFGYTINTFLNIVYIILISRIALLYLLIVLIKYLCNDINMLIMTIRFIVNSKIEMNFIEVFEICKKTIMTV